MMQKFIHRKLYLISGIALCLSIILNACFKEQEQVVNGPAAGPKLPAIPYNYFAGGNNDAAALGRVLFYDRNLSLNNAISCGSCHKQAFAFSDNRQFSRGLNNGLTSRNASALLRLPGHAKFWDGRADDFDTAVFMPVMNKLEMSIFDLRVLPGKLAMIPYYPALFDSAFGTPEITISAIRFALATFLNSMVSEDSKWDRSSWGDELAGLEKRGMDIFFGSGRCYFCHSGNDFNGYQSSYEDIGLDIAPADPGRGNITLREEDNGKFAVPTLRNIALTGPYMHDGRYATLREVIDHYSDGILESKNLSWAFRDFPISDTTSVVPANFASFPILKLNLTEEDKNALEAFLKTLTDVNFIADPKYSSPF